MLLKFTGPGIILGKILKPQNFIFIYLIAFALIPIFFRSSLPHDMSENLYWGKELICGYPKHPPLFAWLSYTFFKLSFSIPESQYILTQLNLAVGIFFIFKISMLLFNDTKKSYAALLISLSALAFSFGNDKFNANTILLSLLPASFYFFMRLLKFQKKVDAFLLGIFAALAVVGKYFALLFLGLMFLFYIFSKEGKRQLKTPLPYIVLFSFLIGISWHICWIFENDFITIKYALNKSAVHYVDSWKFPLQFILMQIVFYGSAVFAYAFSNKALKIIPHNIKIFDTLEKFVIYISVLPSATLFFISLIFNTRIGSMWGVNMISLIGPYMLVVNKNSKFNFLRLQKFAFYSFLVVAVGMSMRYIFANYISLEKSSSSLRAREIARIIDSRCYKNLKNQKIKYINADKKTDVLHAYLKDDPSFYSYDLTSTPWIDEKKALKEGFLYTRFFKKKEQNINSMRAEVHAPIIFDEVITLDDSFAIYFAFIKENGDV